jgi:hypothetical protein
MNLLLLRGFKNKISGNINPDQGPGQVSRMSGKTKSDGFLPDFSGK